MPNDQPRHIASRKFESNTQADGHDREYWLQMTPAERVLHAWQLSVEQFRLAGQPPPEPGVSRSITRVIRNRRDADDV